MNDRFAVSGQCPLRFRERPNCCITATDENGPWAPPCTTVGTAEKALSRHQARIDFTITWRLRWLDRCMR
jgi:hypothetical protein